MADSGAPAGRRTFPWELAALFVLAAGLRLAFFNTLLVGGDPQDRLFYALRFAEGDFSWIPSNRPWLLEALIGAVFWISPRDTVAVAKLVPLAASLGLIPVAYALAREVLGSRPAAAGATLLVAAAPPLVEDSCYLSHQALFTFFASLATLHALRFLRAERERSYGFAFAAALLALYSYIVGFMALGAVLALGLWKLRPRMWRYAAALAAVLWLLPFDYAGTSYYGYAVGGDAGLARFAAGRLGEFLQYYFPWAPMQEDPLDNFARGKFLASAAVFLVPLLAALRRAWPPILMAGAILAPYLPVDLGNPLYIAPTLPLLFPAWIAGARALAPRRAGAALAGLGVAAYLALSAPTTARAIRQAHGDPAQANGVFHSMNLQRVIDWTLANAPAGSRLRPTGFGRYYYFFLRDRYVLVPPAPAFEERIGAAGLDERPALYEELLFEDADYLLLDDAYDFSDIGLTASRHAELTRLIAEDAFARRRLTQAAEVPGSARGVPCWTRVYRIERKD